MAYNEQLKKLRGEKSQGEIAKQIGITKSSWSMYERGERIPRDETKIRIANFLERLFRKYFSVSRKEGSGNEETFKAVQSY